MSVDKNDLSMIDLRESIMGPYIGSKAVDYGSIPHEIRSLRNLVFWAVHPPTVAILRELGWSPFAPQKPYGPRPQ
jgi:hypothetical protein